MNSAKAILVCAFAFLGAWLACAAPERKLVLITTASTQPFSYIDEKTGEIVGIEIDIAREAAESLGCTLEIRRDTFTELLPAVAEGRADLAASGISITEGRRKTVDFSVPYATEGGMFLYRAGENVPSLGRISRRLKIGTMDASTYDFYLVAHGVDPVRFEYYDDAVASLRSGALDTVFYDSCTVRYTAERSQGEFAISRLETRDNFGIAVSKDNAALRQALDKAIIRRYAPGRKRRAAKEKTR